MTIKEFYNCIGGSYDSIINRFGNEDRIKKYVFMFKTDTSYENLLSSVAKKDFDTAFRCAHTLKGLAANLSFDNLFKVSSDLTEIFRNFSNQPYEKELMLVRDEYVRTIEFINQIG